MSTSDGVAEASAPRARPALEVLQADQRRLLDGDTGPGPALRPGVESRRRLIEWYQRAVVRTLGELADVWPPKALLADKVLLAHCLNSTRRRRRFVDDPPGDDVATAFRLRLEAHKVLPAANRAYRELRKVAGEYGEDGREELETVTDPDSQEYVAMRPGFQALDVRQQDALAVLWGGFDDLGTLQEWLHDLNEPSNGELDDDLPKRILADDVAQAHLLGRDVPHRQARGYRERFAVAYLLPAFVAGVQQMDSVELASSTTDRRHVPSG